MRPRALAWGFLFEEEVRREEDLPRGHREEPRDQALRRSGNPKAKASTGAKACPGGGLRGTMTGSEAFRSEAHPRQGWVSRFRRCRMDNIEDVFPDKTLGFGYRSHRCVR